MLAPCSLLEPAFVRHRSALPWLSAASVAHCRIWLSDCILALPCCFVVAGTPCLLMSLCFLGLQQVWF